MGAFDKTIKKTGNFFKKNQKILIPIALILIAMFFAFFLRVQTKIMPVTEDWASNNVDVFYKSQLSKQIEAQYPNLPAQSKNSLLEEQYETFKSQNKEKLERETKELSENFKSEFLNSDEEPYLLAIDPYTYYRYTRNYLDHGHPGDSLKDGKPHDDLMRAPYGVEVGNNFHIVFGALWHNLVTIFNPSKSLMGTFYWLPIIISVLSVIPAFFIGKRIAGDIAGFISAFIVAIHPSALIRTLGGFSDTDPYNIFFPLLIIWMFIEMIRTEDLKRKSIFLGIMTLFTYFYSRAWTGWFYIFDIILLVIFLYAVIEVIINWKDFKGFSFKKHVDKIQNVSAGIIYFILTGLLVTLFKSFNSFLVFIKAPLNFITVQSATTTTIWPNVLTTVAELKTTNLTQIINNMGGNLLFFIAIIGIILSFFVTKENKELKIPLITTLIVWFAVTIYASLNGIRFTLLFVPAFAIAIGVGLAVIIEKVGNFVSENIGLGKTITKIIIFAILILSIIPLYRGAYSSATGPSAIPSMNDAWYDSLTKINLEADEDAIITSWWDFGHWFKAIAERKVTFDGASQGLPQAHWVGRALLTDDEEEARGILRMIDCSANRGYEYVLNITGSEIESVKIIKEIVPVDKSEAKKILESKGIFSNEDVIKLLELTKCNPPEGYFIASGDMIGKAGVWSHFGSWDFEKASILNRYKKNTKEELINYMTNELGYDSQKADDYYYEIGTFSSENEKQAWISPWPGYLSSPQDCVKKNISIICGHSINGQNVAFVINENTMMFDTSQPSPIYPEYLSYNLGTAFLKKPIMGDNVAPFALNLILDENGQYKSFICDPLLTASMFTRMYFYNGAGLNNFELFDYQQQITGNEIFVWKVKW